VELLKHNEKGIFYDKDKTIGSGIAVRNYDDFTGCVLGEQ